MGGRKGDPIQMISKEILRSRVALLSSPDSAQTVVSETPAMPRITARVTAGTVSASIQLQHLLLSGAGLRLNGAQQIQSNLRVPCLLKCLCPSDGTLHFLSHSDCCASQPCLPQVSEIREKSRPPKGDMKHDPNLASPLLVCLPRSNKREAWLGGLQRGRPQPLASELVSASWEQSQPGEAMKQGGGLQVAVW